MSASSEPPKMSPLRLSRMTFASTGASFDLAFLVTEYDTSRH